MLWQCKPVLGYINGPLAARFAGKKENGHKDSPAIGGAGESDGDGCVIHHYYILAALKMQYKETERIFVS